jgi:DNA-binding FadR family transcriptional regulator
MKAGEQLAQRVVDEIAARGWPVGEILGTEPDLMATYGVSRGTFREAVRILEHLGCARMREGRGGGLMVTAPESGPVTQAAAVYLRYQGVDTDSLHTARCAIELDLVARATARMDDERADELRAALVEETEVAHGPDPGFSPVHTAIARLAGNEPLALFAYSLMSLSDEYGRSRLGGIPATATAEAKGASRRAHQAIVEAMVAGDVELATHRMRVHLDAVERWMRD